MTKHANVHSTDKTTPEKAKVLWSANYETDKFVLLETVLMLSFMGPQMNSVYNACSWLDFAFTIAESMGIHRSTSSLGVNNKDKGRVKRLWWTLAVRDAYCAALLGRPFRINIPQCDVSMLEIDDFASELTDLNRDSALYQIAVAQLSIIARNIIQRRFHSSETCLNLNDLQEDLRVWRVQLPASLSSSRASTMNQSIFPKSLDLLYHQHMILLHSPSNRFFRLGTRHKPNDPPPTARSLHGILHLGHSLLPSDPRRQPSFVASRASVAGQLSDATVRGKRCVGPGALVDTDIRFPTVAGARAE
jgi:hypothetical protein